MAGLPIEIWSSIMSEITNLKDLLSLRATCHLFNELVKDVKVIEGRQSISSSLLSTFPNVRICKPWIQLTDPRQIKKNSYLTP